MNPLLEKMRKARQRDIEVAPGKFITLTRPTEMNLVDEAIERQSVVDKDGNVIKPGKVITIRDYINRYVVGWKGFYEGDFIEGAGTGNLDSVPFDKELLIEWLEDKFTIADNIIAELFKLVTEHTNTKETRLGESEAGSV